MAYFEDALSSGSDAEFTNNINQFLQVLPSCAPPLAALTMCCHCTVSLAAATGCSHYRFSPSLAVLNVWVLTTHCVLSLCALTMCSHRLPQCAAVCRDEKLVARAATGLSLPTSPGRIIKAVSWPEEGELEEVHVIENCLVEVSRGVKRGKSIHKWRAREEKAEHALEEHKIGAEKSNNPTQSHRGSDAAASDALEGWADATEVNLQRASESTADTLPRGIKVDSHVDVSPRSSSPGREEARVLRLKLKQDTELNLRTRTSPVPTNARQNSPRGSSLSALGRKVAGQGNRSQGTAQSAVDVAHSEKVDVLERRQNEMAELHLRTASSRHAEHSTAQSLLCNCDVCSEIETADLMKQHQTEINELQAHMQVNSCRHVSMQEEAVRDDTITRDHSESSAQRK